MSTIVFMSLRRLITRRASCDCMRREVLNSANASKASLPLSSTPAETCPDAQGEYVWLLPATGMLSESRTVLSSVTEKTKSSPSTGSPLRFCSRRRMLLVSFIISTVPSV